MVNIKVAVRIRPLSQRELLHGEESVVRKENKSILVTNPKIPERQDGDSRQRTRSFAVDFCYDPKEPEGCSQEAVFKEIGEEVLDSMFEGYNACVLAYGHSASGKTYTIMGLQEDPGLTPRLCQALFEKLNGRCLDGKIRVQVLISFLEIYNEKVRDLLRSEDTGATSSNFSLRVREHPKLGPYVQGLSEHLVTDRKKLLELLATGNRRRSTAATENNIHSSRSHAVFTIQFKQSDGENYETEKSSKVHLVDLAGSLQEVSQQETYERASSPQSKARLKEGANINKSLVTLGNVISALAESYESGTFSKEHSSLKSWQPFVPYRDSVLTWLLKDTLGGNSNTIMIATISPAGSCLSETVNTLRYAKRTKRIVNKPIVNEDPKIRTIRQLRKEIARLKRLLLSFQSYGSWCELEDLNCEEAIGFPSPESKWLDPGGTKVTVGRGVREAIRAFQLERSSAADSSLSGAIRRDSAKAFTPPKPPLPRTATGSLSPRTLPRDPTSFTIEEGDHNKKENYLKSPTEKREEEKINKEKEEKRIFENFEWSTSSNLEEGVLSRGAAPQGGDACKINDEKKSDVNGSVNDIFSHETQIFSDSLESFSSVFLKSENSCDADNDGSGHFGVAENAYDIREASAENLIPCLKQELSSFENLSKRNFSAMLHRSRPDLIKGISTRSKEGLPSGSSQSCTDVSNLSQSTSENSLNSSGSVDVQPSEKRNPRIKNPLSPETGPEGREDGARRKSQGNETLQIAPKKKEKRSDLVEAVTSRLYVTKKKPDLRTEAPKKEEEENGDLEELKLCKRTRMKLFDLSRKLAVTRKIKKTVDNDTQTDNMTATLRVKEKCVTTDLSGIPFFETIEIPEESSIEPKKPCVIMKQIILPKALNYLVECGKVVRMEAPEMEDKQESATQTAPEERKYKNANTSPIKCSPRDEDFFSEDSLDLEDKSKGCGTMLFGENKKTGGKSDSEDNVNFNWPPDSEVYFSCDTNKCFSIESKSQDFQKNANKSKETLLNKFELGSFIDVKEENLDFVSKALFSNNLEESKKDENLSSENSFTSAEGTDISCSSETSSEDFVFYENPKDKDAIPKVKASGDRELYTITENSEQSDLSDTFSPLQSQRSFVITKEECGEFDKSLQRSQADILEKEIKEKPKMLIQVKEAKKSLSLPKHSAENIESSLDYSENTGERRNSAELCSKIVKNFKQSYNVNENKSNNLKVPNSVGPITDTDSKSPHPVPNYNAVSWFPADLATADRTDNKNSNPEDLQGHFRDPRTKPKQINWADYQSNSQKQYLNLNISGSNKTPPFSVDTHLFGKASKKDQSTDTISNSADSITFIFMGPAKPKTSVLLEIIRRSLGKSSSNDIPFTQRKSRSRGVQCDADLIRSVSIDTAMIALSRIAKNQEPSSVMQRTSSLGTLSQNETMENGGIARLPGQRETSCQCNLRTECFYNEKRHGELSHSNINMIYCEQTNDKIIENKKLEEAEKPKKSVSWSGEAKNEEGQEPKLFAKEDKDVPDLDANHRNSAELEMKKSPERNLSSAEFGIPERRVRFLKPEIWNLDEIEFDQTSKHVEQVGSLTAFLKEATQLLKNINFLSTKHQVFAEEAVEDPNGEAHRRKLENEKGGLKRLKKTESITRSKTETCFEKEAIWRSRVSERKTDEDQFNLTWPRRRPVTRKPPIGMKSKFPRSPVPSRSDSLRFNCSPNLTRICSQSSRMGLCDQSLNSSNLSMPLSNSWLNTSQSKPLSTRSFHYNETRLARDYSPSGMSRSERSKLNFDSISELEKDLEESCRRLELAAEQEKLREKIKENQIAITECYRQDMRSYTKSTEWEAECLERKKKAREVIKRRKTQECVWDCSCRESTRGQIYPCKYLWSKGCRSNFELDSFGPGSTHCRQLCMFCRKTNVELYSSAINLNSKCYSELCRLNYYGFCPCSSVRLSHVASSPRAYMQHLLALRRQIVSETKRNQFDSANRSKCDEPR